MTPLLEVKFLEHSGPKGKEKTRDSRETTEDDKRTKERLGMSLLSECGLSDLLWMTVCGRFAPSGCSIDWRTVYGP